MNGNVQGYFNVRNESGSATRIIGVIVMKDHAAAWSFIYTSITTGSKFQR